MRSERVTVLLSPEEKARLAQRAASLQIPIGELMRRAVAGYDPEADTAELEALADELERAVDAAEASLDKALAKLDEFYKEKRP